ncbi:hypothetical protein GCM10010389_55940 [Streptomyces echinoruber]|uniref:Uncharacterized protein n=1 Tax=Streptomyces echinoruber TaxID=68898 RepID=A0A918VMM7_9ACTN|nr:hypothetical protein GCM10010389_55940 [Streptomyces echinoruber]
MDDVTHSRHRSGGRERDAGDVGSSSTSCLCTARSGYDGPTGWGTPEGVTAFIG